jgi:hypothetical protein
MAVVAGIEAGAAAVMAAGVAARNICVGWETLATAAGWRMETLGADGAAARIWMFAGCDGWAT